MTRILFLSLFAVPLLAAPAHVVRFSAAVPSPFTCTAVGYYDFVTFYNTTSKPLTVRVLGVSNGSPFVPGPDHLDVPPGAAVSDDGVRQLSAPKESPYLWVMHYDVPEGIVMESRNEILLESHCFGHLFVQIASAGKTSLPIFREAVPANQPQVHLGTDVGSSRARINVGIYNQASVPAHAHIEVRRTCDGLFVGARDVMVPADTIVQFTGFNSVTGGTCPSSPTTAMEWMRHTIVTVDQPSMTYVVALNDKNELPDLPTPKIEIAIPSSVRY